MTTTKHQDLVDAIVSDHREFEAVFDEIEASGDPRMRRELVEHVIAGLVRHSVAEEEYLYPTARKALPDGDKIADHEIEEHAEAEQLMKEIENTEATDPKFDELVGKLIAEIRHHLSDEEEDLLPKLRKACSQQDLRDLGEKFERAKRMAPTRPHPSAPDHPPANKILGPGVGLIDKMRDALTNRNT
ncbi:hemerythrin domain-containing protein [Actinophytocola gossypii]|uniref:Hemerythrin domain-containing protein n=1 Tax=Actinophytocola gossypii TaxID=2812003 RepID=A0ABT2J1B5_9PSEU|nr:hemerythrin domain-containing protein [Actinophytocola gossypii]MCT2581551.1 hemerythrin domain-containing protein [Actinophytocola gossypii]